MKKSLWTEMEIKELFNSVQNRGKKSLLKIFADHSEKFGRKPNSVRNYYYDFVSVLEKDKSLCDKFGIDISMHQKSIQKTFSKEEKEECMTEINKLLDMGYTVRSACLKLAEGDAKKMLRYQNKFRSENKPSNVITMPSKTLSDSEINSLFMGLVKLIKKCALEQASAQYVTKLDNANVELRRAMVEIAGKEEQISSLKKNFELLKNEKTTLSEELVKLRSENVEKGEKINALKSFIEKFSSNQKFEAENK